MNYLRAYVMTWDTGFAPNPYHGILTLATCKPVIRRCAQAGDWIAGWTAKKVVGKKGVVSFVDGQKLIYLAKVSEIIKLEDYWNRFPQKRPIENDNTNSSQTNSCGKATAANVKPVNGCTGKRIEDIRNCGDNIYESTLQGWIQHKNNGGHGEKDKEHDLSGKNALICKEFYYFGVENNKALDVSSFFKIHIPRQKKLDLRDPGVEQLINYVKQHSGNATVKGSSR